MPDLLSVLTISFGVFIGATLLSSGIMTVNLKRDAGEKLVRRSSGKIGINELKQYRKVVTDEKVKKKIDQTILLLRLAGIAMIVFPITFILIMFLGKK